MENRWEDFWKSGRVEDYLGYCQNPNVDFKEDRVQDSLAASGYRKKEQKMSSLEKGGLVG